MNKPEYHTDGRSPATFNETSPLDPGLFYQVNQFAEDMLQNERSGKISPLETANLLEENSLLAQYHLHEAEEEGKNQNDPTFRRWAIDVEAQIGFGLFFANKFRAGTAYAFSKE